MSRLAGFHNAVTWSGFTIAIAALLLATSGAQQATRSATLSPTATLELPPTPVPPIEFAFRGVHMNGVFVCSSRLVPGAFNQLQLGDPSLNNTLLAQVAQDLVQFWCADGYSFIAMANSSWGDAADSTTTTDVIRGADGLARVWSITSESSLAARKFYAWQPTTLVQVKVNISTQDILAFATADMALCEQRTCPAASAGVAVTPQPATEAPPTPAPVDDNATTAAPPGNTTVSGAPEEQVESTTTVPTWLIAAVVVIATLIIICCVLSAVRNGKEKAVDPRGLSKYRSAEERRFDQAMPTVSTGEDQSPARGHRNGDDADDGGGGFGAHQQGAVPPQPGYADVGPYQSSAVHIHQ